MVDHHGVVLADEVIPRSGGHALYLERGVRIRIRDTHGGHVPNLICMGAGSLETRLSMATTRLMTARWNLTLGMTLYSSQARPMLTVVADTVGKHHLEGGYCTEPGNITRLGGAGGGPNCYDTLAGAFAHFAIGSEQVQPDMCVALFLQYMDAPDGRRTRAPASLPGGMIEFKAEADLVVAVSDCPHPAEAANSDGRASLRVVVTRSR